MKVIDTEKNRDIESNVTARNEILRQARSQPSLANTFDELLGDGGQPNETAEEMIRAIREWRDVPSTRSFD